MRCPVSFRILLPFDNGKWSRFGFNLLYTQSLIWCQILNPKLAKYLINPLSDICRKLKPVFSWLARYQARILCLVTFCENWEEEKYSDIYMSKYVEYLHRQQWYWHCGRTDRRQTKTICKNIFWIPCSKVKKSYMHFSYLRTKHCML